MYLSSIIWLAINDLRNANENAVFLEPLLPIIFIVNTWDFGYIFISFGLDSIGIIGLSWDGTIVFSLISSIRSSNLSFILGSFDFYITSLNFITSNDSPLFTFLFFSNENWLYCSCWNCFCFIFNTFKSLL